MTDVNRLADAIIRETENRITKKQGNAATLNYVFGTVTLLAGQTAAVDRDDENGVIPNARIPKYTPLNIGDRVRVALDATGTAYITEVY